MLRCAGQGRPVAVWLARHGVAVIPGGCPMMLCQPVDLPYRCLRWVLSVTGGLPKAT